MSGQPTSAGLSPRAANRGLIAGSIDQWRSFARFLRRPVLPDRAQLSLTGSVRALLPLFALDMALMVIVLGAIGVAAALGFKLPEHLLNALTLTPALVAFMVVGAPIGEEIIFRGWLSGRIGHILGSLGFAAAAVLLLIAAQHAAAGNPDNVPLTLAAVGAALLGAVMVFAFRRRTAMGWFQRHFAWFYYASALLFAAVHLTNFAGTAGPAAAQLALVLPQLVLGLILGYLRVNRGLVTGAALHMLHNSVFAGLMLAGAS